MTSTRTVLLPTHPTAVHPHTGLPLVALYVDRKGRPRWPMMGAAPEGEEGGTGGGAGEGGAGGAGEGGSGSGDGGSRSAGPGTGSGAGTSDGEKKLDLTQERLDQIVSEAKAKEKKRFEEQLEQIKADAGKTEIEKLTAERDRYKDAADGASKAAAQRAAQSEAKLQANLAGARSDRLSMVLKQADLDDVLTDDGEVDDAKVKAAVGKVLEEFPEWKRTAGKSGEELGGKGGEGKPTFTRQQIKDMSPDERARRIDELNSAMAEGRITG